MSWSDFAKMVGYQGSKTNNGCQSIVSPALNYRYDNVNISHVQ